MVKVDFSQIDLKPPVGGSPGLPLTIRWQDQYSNNAPGSPDGEKWPIFDSSLWADPHSHAAVGPGGATASAQQLITAQSPYAFGADISSAGSRSGEMLELFDTTEGALASLDHAVLNHQWGTLDLAQIVQVAGNSRYDQSKIVNRQPGYILTSTELGRFTGLGRRIRTNNARPGNASWQDEMFRNPNNGTTDERPVVLSGADQFLSATTAKSVLLNPLPAGASLAGAVTAQVYSSKIAYPSGGFGAMWGNYHDSGFSIGLSCSAFNFNLALGNTGFKQLPVEAGISDSYQYHNYWSLAHTHFRRLTENGVTPSGIEGWRTPVWPTGLATNLRETYTGGRYTDGIADAFSGQPDYTPHESTLQIPAVYDQISTVSSDTRTIPDGEPGIFPIGRPDLGNSVVTDSAGLIGFEGFITVTGFVNVSLNANSDDDDAQEEKQYFSGQLYGGLNIQVHSGAGPTRNAMTTSADLYPTTYLYGSDGTPVLPLTDALKTSASRKINNGGSTTVWEPTVDSNQTTFFSYRKPSTSATQGAVGAQSDIPANMQNSASPMISTGRAKADRLLGDDHQAGTTWNGTNKLTCAWMAEKIPTKVQVIPSIVGYKDIQVTPGSAKLTAHPSASNITLRKPIVDYHILVSVVNENQVGPRTADIRAKAAGSKMGEGNRPLARNSPGSGYLTHDANYDRKYCEIWHSIVRINPDTLEQVFIDPANPKASEFNQLDCPNMVMPKHNYGKGHATQGWGLHQLVPFRPIANRTWSRVPRLCATIEPGGFYQRGGIGHLWDADVYGGELFVGADVMRPEDLSPSGSTSQTNPTDGQPEWRDSIYGRGQMNLDGNADPALPSGSELLIFKWSPSADFWYPGAGETSKTTSPIWAQAQQWVKDGVTNLHIVDGGYNHTVVATDVNNRAGFDVSDSNKVLTSCWDVHDWVFPQIELMAYLGQEDKGNMGSDGSVPLHPTLHCSALRIMEDGKMMMAAIHRDNIKSPFDFPSAVIGNPFNPDSGGGSCPPGYYQQGNECKPITGNGADDPGGGMVLDPITGQPQQPPQPQGGGGNQTSAATVFGLVPSWGTLIGGTSARSLIMLWTDAPAVDGKVVQGRRNFGLTWSHVGDGGTTGQWIAKQRWEMPDTWWSGSRTAYWFPESGQRAIPITYGCYPETRLTSASLPRSAAWIDSNDNIIHGYPYEITGPRLRNNSLYQNRTGVDLWWTGRDVQFKLQKYIPTTPQFTDLAAGSNPWQELGWAGWSFKAGLFDPIGYDATAYTFSDDPEKQISISLPRSNGAPFKDFMGRGPSVIVEPTVDTEAPNANAVIYYPIDISSSDLPNTRILDWEIGPPGAPALPGGLPAPIPAGSFADLSELILRLKDPSLTQFSSLMNDYFITNPQELQMFPFLTDPKTGFACAFLSQGASVLEPVTHASTRWGPLTYQIGGNPVVTVQPQIIINTGNRLNYGGSSCWTHFGPLHYGASSNGHPYRTDRVWSMVHAGLGYDLPLHYLAPGPVQVRARAGGSNTLNLEMETPFHRTDTKHLEGLADLYTLNSQTGFDKAGTGTPGGTPGVLGQYYLRTNLWGPFGDTRNIGTALVPGIHGPIPTADPDSLTPFWSDHPTDRFHAGAVPFGIGTDIDIAEVSRLRYPMPNLANSDEWSAHDLVSLGEQLQSSVDVHVSKAAKPFWDSGSIVTAQGLGYGVSDTTSGQYGPLKRSPQSGYGVPGSIDWGATWAATPVCPALGMGQRILRTPEGTLHIFSLRRSAQVPQGSSWLSPCWNHYKKPLFGDMFFNSKRLRPSPATATYDGKDEVRPILQHVETSRYTHSRICGAAFAADSNGTIHAVLEISFRGSKGLTTERAAHQLIYTHCDRDFITANPEPVYDWDWTKIGFNYQIINPDAANEFVFDLRQPSLVCDSEDRLHLAFIDVRAANNSQIVYTSKLSDETTFQPFNLEDSSYQIVSLDDETSDARNIAASGPHSTRNADYPKICLRGDNIPVVFYRGCSERTGEPNRNKAAVYVNVGRAGSAANDPSGRFSFDAAPYQCLGLEPMYGVHTLTTYGVTYYDAVIDERDRAQVVAIVDDSLLLSIFNTRKPLVDQYTATEGLGMARLLYQTRTSTGHTMTEPTLTIDGDGSTHLVIAHALGSPGDAAWYGSVSRTGGIKDEAVWPIQWPGIGATDYANPGGASGPGSGGYDIPTGSVVQFPMQTASQAALIPQSGPVRHHVEIWWPSLEFDHATPVTDLVLRSINVRWLSVPSLQWDNTKGWIPVASAQSMGGQEDFPHYAAQLRYQRFWGHNATDLDMAWLTNELSWVQSMHEQSRLMHPFGMSAMYGFFDEPTEGLGIPGYYS